MAKPPRLVRAFIGVLGALPFLPLLVLVLFVLSRSNPPARSLALGLSGAILGAAFLWFWFRANGPWARGLCLSLVTAAALVASLVPDSIHGAYLAWIYPAILLGFAFPPLRAAAAGLAVGVAIVLIVLVQSWVLHFGSGQSVGAALPPLAVLALACWAAITGSQLLRNYADLQAARQELARLAIEEERARFARDLHDLLGHTLSLIVVKLELATKLLPNRESPAGAELRETEQLAREALRDVREVVGGYRQPTLAAELAGAGVALEAAGIGLTIHKDVTVLPPEVEATLAWAVREGVTNVVRHSGARACTIRIAQDTNHVTIEVSDDGAGHDSAKAGMGLTGLRERVEKRGGSLAWKAAHAKGFTLSADVPLQGST